MASPLCLATYAMSIAFSLRAVYKGQKHILFSAISIKGLVGLKTIKVSMKSKNFEAFIRDDLDPHLSSENVEVMDNLKSHKSTQVQQLITTTGTKPLCLPRYFPDFNPIEMLWSVLKSFVRKFKPHSLSILRTNKKRGQKSYSSDKVQGLKQSTK